MSPHSEENQIFRTAATVRKEDDNIHPRELSGDQNEEESILASYANNAKANFFLTTTLIIKTTIGAGIISLPYAIRHLGYVLSIIVFIIFFALNQLCSVLLLKSKNLSRHSNYSTILSYIWRHDGAKLFGSALIFLDNLGTCILEFIIMKTSIRHIAQQVSNDPNIINQLYISDWAIILFVGALEFPLVMIKKIEKLRFFSFMGVAGIIIFIIGVIILYIIRRSQGFPGMQMNAFPDDWFAAASVLANIIFAFDFQMNFFPIFKGLKDPTDKRMERACLTGLIGCAVPYLTVGFLGYSLQGSNVESNFLLSISYSETNPTLYFIINASYLFSILFAIVLMFFSCRNNFISMVIVLRKKWKERQSKKLKNEEKQILQSQQDTLLSKSARIQRANKEYIIFTIFLYVIIVVVSIFVQDIQVIFNFLGAVCQTLIMILLPCLFYVRLVGMGEQPKRFIYYLSIAIIVVITPYSIFSVVANYINMQ